MLTKTFAKVIAGILAMLALPASAVAAEEETQTPTASLLPNASFETNAIEGVEGWASRAWHGKENAKWSVGSPGRTGKHCISIGSVNRLRSMCPLTLARFGFVQRAFTAPCLSGA